MVFDFFKRGKQVDVGRYLQRLINVTTPNRPMAEDLRAVERYNRTIPVLMNPWCDSEVVLSETKIAFTRDLSDHGLGVITLADLIYKQYVVTAWPKPEELPEPYHFLCTVREVKPLMLGLWIAGMEVSEFLNDDRRGGVEQLQEIAEKSLLPIDAETVAMG